MPRVVYEHQMLIFSVLHFLFSKEPDRMVCSRLILRRRLERQENGPETCLCLPLFLQACEQVTG
jgi:hypothetical protein